MANNTASPRTGLQKRLHQVTDIFYQPFSSKALDQLPRRDSINPRTTAKRADRIPDVQPEEDRPLVRNYQATANGNGINVKVPKKISTPVKVETKVWLANERTWISYISIAVLMSTMSLALWNASAEGSVGRIFGWVYAAISILVLIYGFALFQKRLTMISSRSAEQFDQLWGPLLICAALFIAILVNFIIRYRELRHTVEGALW